ncbi:MAG TPA: ABC transporter permease [Thermomicrobiales bacterium]|nr:ABC transporter permease [Thermomicrobiales bacterium]
MSTVQETERSTTAGARPTVDRNTLERIGKPRTYLGMAWRRLRRNKLAMIGAGIMILMILIALGAGLISEFITHKSLSDQSLRDNYMGIGEGGYILGSDDLGRDTLTRLVYGARVSLGVAGLSVLVALTVGTVVGTLAGYYGKWVDSVLMRFVDIMLSIPTLFLLLLVATLWRMGPWKLALVIAAVAWVTLSRLVRGEVMSVKGRDYIDAARVVGVGNRRIMFRHILPNVAPVIIVWASLVVPGLILTEATLSFLGLGVQPPTPSWGNMLTSAQKVWSHSTAMVLLPGFAIYITVFAINLFGNGLRDALDPRLTD